MSTDRDDRWNDDQDDDRRSRRPASGSVANGQAKARTAGNLLLAYGLFALVLSLGLLVLYAASVDTIAKPYHEWMKGMFKDVPRQPGQPEPVPPYSEFATQMQVQGSISTAISALGAAGIVFGALRMRSTSSRGLAMIAAILALIPCTSSCCILGMPIGIWALIVLNNPDVKAAFEASQIVPDDQ